MMDAELVRDAAVDCGDNIGDRVFQVGRVLSTLTKESGIAVCF